MSSRQVDISRVSAQLTSEYEKTDVINAEFSILLEYDHLLKRNATKHFPTSLKYQKKNRWTDDGFEVYANEETRIKLTVNDVVQHDYINANFISKNLIGSYCNYIATQAPMSDWIDGTTVKEETITDFWNMIWDYNVPVIVMLCRLVEEENRIKAHQYWPNTDCQQTYLARTGGSMSVRLSREYQYENYEEIVIREMVITYNGEERTVNQVHFIGWPDNSIPTNHESFMGLLKAADSMMKGSSGPMTVHCSAGVGRTGTFICIHSTIQRMLEHKESGSSEMFKHKIFDTVQQMKQLRWQLVYNEQQYAFCYNAILLAANNMWGRDSTDQMS
jgi:protein tyrosine phosphatase